MKNHLFSFLSVALVMSGCSSVRTLEIAADPAMAAASVQVDVVQDSPEAQSVAVSQYFLPGNMTRASLQPKRTVRFGSGPATQSVSVSDFKGKAVVLAHLPGGHQDAAGDADSRRKTIPLKGKGTASTMVVKVTQGGLSVTPKGK